MYGHHYRGWVCESEIKYGGRKDEYSKHQAGVCNKYMKSMVL